MIRSSFFATLSLIFAILGSQVANFADENKPYSFAIPPFQCLEKIEPLRKLAGAIEYEPSQLEKELLLSLSQGNLSDSQWVDAFLIASGEQRTERHDAHREAIDDFVARIRPKLESLSHREQGEKILHELHKTLLSGGYDENQSSLATLLESKKFNCVSSSVLYFLVCKRVGLTLDILEFPGSQFLTGHVMAMFVDGESRIDVETTNAEGFDIRRKITEGGGYSLSIKNINDAWKIDDRGLLRAVYCNRLVGSDEAGRWYDSLKLRTIMLALTPDSKTCQESFLRGFTNWTVSLNDSMRMPDSIAVLKIGLEIASDDYGFTTDLEYAHAKLAATLIANQQDDKVTMLFRQAQSIWPKVDFQRKQVEAYILVVQDKIKSADYSESIDILGRGIEAADGDAKDGLKRVRAEYYCDWSNELVKNKKHEAAAATLITALKHDPDDFIVLGGIAYMTQETLEMIDATNGPASASRWMETLHKKFPDLRQIVEPAKTHVYLLVDKQLKLKDYTKARQTMNERNRLLTKESTAELACRIVDWEAKDLMEQKKWSEAIQVYQLGLKSYPDSHHLKNNLAYAEQSAKSQ